MNKQPTSRSCFLCGRQNDIGLKMTWHNDNEAQQVWSEVIVPAGFNSYPGVVHGGIVAALLDETSGRALMLNGKDDELFITTRLEVKYHQPTPTEQPLRVIGWIIKRNSRFAHVAGEIHLADGTLTAKCEATIARPPQKFFDKWGWKNEAKDWRVDE
ncbi:MAG: thioesterase [Firmicutes bacterium HGW-Firmicutes-15]|nr:MAG: thioesterase [Firmicutes bacterium HGW-Firmicutes-15]